MDKEMDWTSQVQTTPNDTKVITNPSALFWGRAECTCRERNTPVALWGH